MRLTPAQIWRLACLFGTGAVAFTVGTRPDGTPALFAWLPHDLGKCGAKSK